MKNILSIDLESWIHFHGDIFGAKKGERSYDRKRSDNCYIISATNCLLEILSKQHKRATFFVLGEIFEWYPELIVKIEQAGHEIGYHGHDHQIIKNNMVLEDQLKKSQTFIDTFKPKGFRAPQIYLPIESIRVLRDWGFKFSSSTYGEYTSRRNIQSFEEIPVSSLRYFGKTTEPVSFPRQLTLQRLLREIPFGSGLFFSLFQSKISHFIKKVEKRGEPVILFVHPWQICPFTQITNNAYRIKVALKNPLSFPYTISIRNAFEKVLNRHHFTSFREVLNEHQGILE